MLYVDLVINEMKNYFFETIVKYGEEVVSIDSHIYGRFPDLGADLKIYAVREAEEMLKEKGYKSAGTGYGGLRQGWWMKFEKDIYVE